MISGSVGSGIGNWLWVPVALLVPQWHAVKGLMIAVLPTSGDDAIGTATGIFIGLVLIVMPFTFLTGSFIPIKAAIDGYGWAFLLIAPLSSTSMIRRDHLEHCLAE